MSNSYRRPLLRNLVARLREPRKFLQVLTGPRQVGKTTLVRQAIADLEIQAHYASADDPALQSRTWLSQQWDLGRLRARNAPEGQAAVLVLDEVQKIPEWAGSVKAHWDEDSTSGTPLHVVLLGSAPLLLQRGLGESLAGRFELLRLGHWNFFEMREAFGWDLDQFIFFGGYPGAAPLIADLARWRDYVRDSLVETTLSRDILVMTRVDKPALLRRVFHLACAYSGQILSYQKMLGQLQDAGNTTTLAHYLNLLASAGLVTGVPKFAGEVVRQRASSPKLQAFNTALITSQAGLTIDEARVDREYWG
ncbi:MAG: ATP-binding protein, partial [Candidatus Sericytochromatia bacterium]|nr:ATP-binding protein [Candidatus Tanganyikabacteria bacterium]